LPGELVTITGVNFHNDPTVCIGDYCNIQVIYINDTTIQFIIPDITVPSGTINTRRTDSDEIEDETDDNFIVIRPVISVGGIFRRD
jgi:hypothetical protein